jgi:hypothetical protein
VRKRKKNTSKRSCKNEMQNTSALSEFTKEQGVTNKISTKSCKYGERSKAKNIRVATNMQTQFKTNCTKLLLITNLTHFF